MPQPLLARSQKAANSTGHNAEGQSLEDQEENNNMTMGVKHGKHSISSQGITSTSSSNPSDSSLRMGNDSRNNDSRGRLGLPNSNSFHMKSSPGPKGLAKELQRTRDQFPQKQISVVKIKSWIDKKITTTDETSSGVLKYKTPHFRTTATVDIPALYDGEKLQLGWIQTCSSMEFINTYGSHGVTSWEFPEIQSGKYEMISDADGKAYPWYGAKKEMQTIKGPCDRQMVSVEMNDNFFPQVTWHIPDEAYDRRPRLTHVYRKQRFYTCLAVRDCCQNRIYIYKTVSWNMELNIKVNPEKPLGERAQLEGPFEQEAPKVLRSNVKLPIYALKAPNANRSQALVWRPFKGEPHMVVAPIESTMTMDEYLNSTSHLVDKLKCKDCKPIAGSSS